MDEIDGSSEGSDDGERVGSAVVGDSYVTSVIAWDEPKGKGNLTRGVCFLTVGDTVGDSVGLSV